MNDRVNKYLDMYFGKFRGGSCKFYDFTYTIESSSVWATQSFLAGSLLLVSDGQCQS